MLRIFVALAFLVALSAASIANEGGPQGGGSGASGNGDKNGSAWCPPGIGHPDCN